jgi:hypothetical protein
MDFYKLDQTIEVHFCLKGFFIVQILNNENNIKVINYGALVLAKIKALYDPMVS